MSAYRIYTLVTLMLVIAILMPEAQYTRSDVFQYGQNGQVVNDVPHQYCGRKLSSTLQIVCGSVYNSRFKKSNQVFSEMEVDNYMTYSYDLHPYKSIENARKMLRSRRNSRGIYEECCLKPCMIEELKSYCGSR
ncbi:unnamed protein product [Xylocopa violacea]|uniref:Insulin-like domain-containing protein n=1 Tax=Xylocopa violacea TaxID=135666 RepID=A0ABP1N0E1_XYLVO